MSKLKTIKNLFRPSRKKIIILAVLLVILTVVLVKAQSSSKTAVELSTVKKQDIAATLSVSGTLQPYQSAQLHFLGSGKMTYLNVSTTDHVVRGQAIAGQDIRDLAASLQQAENNLRSSQSKVDKVLDDISQYQYGNSTTGETMTQRELRTESQVTRDNAYDSVKQAQLALQNSVIYSPIAGTVAATGPVAGQYVTSADQIAEIVNWSKVYFEAEVDESDIGKIKEGQKARISLDSYPDKTFSGTVDTITPKTEKSTSGATVVIVKIDLGHPDINLIEGLSGQVDITYQEAQDVLSIPIESIQGDNTVIVKTPSGFEKAQVETGLQSDSNIEIKKGLNEGEEIATNPAGINLSKGNIFSRIFKF